MMEFHLAVALCLALILSGLSPAEQPPQVLVTESGTLGPRTSRHTVGLQRHRHTIVLDTAAQTYALRYVVALDPNNPQAAIPGEGYIGMSQSSNHNWYTGGFFDLRLNGQNVDTMLIHSLTG